MLLLTRNIHPLPLLRTKRQKRTMMTNSWSASHRHKLNPGLHLIISRDYASNRFQDMVMVKKKRIFFVHGIDIRFLTVHSWFNSEGEKRTIRGSASKSEQTKDDPAAFPSPPKPSSSLENGNNSGCSIKRLVSCNYFKFCSQDFIIFMNTQYTQKPIFFQIGYFHG